MFFRNANQETDTSCCRNIHVNLEGRVSKTYSRIGELYRSKTGGYIIWSAQFISWIFVDRIKPAGSYTQQDIKLRLLESNQARLFFCEVKKLIKINHGQPFKDLSNR